MIKRDLFTDLKAHLDQKEISLIIGPRQAGKTTLMLLLADYLKKKNKKSIIFNLDIESDKKYFSSQSSLVKKIKLEIGLKKGYVFIDGIQRKEDAGLFLKGIYDMNLPYKFIVSGSGSLELKEKTHESLVGRKRVFQLSTLSFSEFINFKTDYSYADKLKDYFSLEKAKTDAYLKEYLDFGGYPRVVLSETKTEKQKIIEEIYQSFMEKDISALLGLKKTEALSNLIKIIAAQTGSLVNHMELSATLGISFKTIKDYLWYLEKTFILKKLTPHFTNMRKEIIKTPVYYFNDLGLRNYALGFIGHDEIAPGSGFHFQNFIFNLLMGQSRTIPLNFNYWRTKDGAEVDFIIRRGNKFLPLEAKYQRLKNTRISRSFKSFIARYHPERAVIINLTLAKQIRIADTIVNFYPFHRLITKRIKF